MLMVKQLEITETPEQLLAYKKTCTKMARIKVEWLYLMASEQARSLTHASTMVGVNPATGWQWVKHYRKGGLQELAHGVMNRAPRRQTTTTTTYPKGPYNTSIPKAAILADLEAYLKTNSFANYEELHWWIEGRHDLEIRYSTLHRIVHTGLSPEALSRIQSRHRVAG